MTQVERNEIKETIELHLTAQRAEIRADYSTIDVKLDRIEKRMDSLSQQVGEQDSEINNLKRNNEIKKEIKKYNTKLFAIATTVISLVIAILTFIF